MIQEKNILVVEDDVTVYPILTRMIHRMNPNAHVQFAASAEAAEIQLKGFRQKFDVILSDIGLAGEKTGFDLLNNCHFEIAPIPVVLTSGTRHPLVAAPFLIKPFRYENVFEKLSPYLNQNAPRPQSYDHSEKIWFASLAVILTTFFVLVGGQMEHFPLVSNILR